MRFVLFPDSYVSSVYDMDFEALYEAGYRGIIFDVDNTLVPHNAPADERSRELFRRLNKIGFKTIMVSNNKEPRVKKFTEEVGGTGYLYKANKPLTKAYRRAMWKMGTRRDSTLCIGDQLFTDILGANFCGIKTVLTEPVEKWHEEIQIIFKRIPESIILFIYNICNYNQSLV